MNTKNLTLPDIISESTALQSSHIDWVGMEKIALPLKFPLDESESVGVSASADIFVSLDSEKKGIHMSRIYLKLQEFIAEKVISSNCLNGLLEAMIHSQDSHSKSAKVNLEFDLPLLKKALLSDNSGYQSYPIKICQQLIDGKQLTQLQVTIPYSSTCPCSASLSRQLISEAVDKQFAKDNLSKTEIMDWLAANSIATPHNQRSYAYIELTTEGHEWPNLPLLVEQLESAIGTPVQTAVKREDEQAFAKLNAENLMFCEDAARKLDSYLDSLSFVSDFYFKVEHQESLHAHNAVVTHRKRKK